MVHQNTILKAKHVSEIAKKFYEPGRQDKCYMQVWRHCVYPIYPISYRTFMRYLKLEGITAKNNRFLTA